MLDGAIGVSDLDPRAFTPDELADGWRLACRANAHDDLVVEVPPLQTRPKAALAGVGRHVILRPAVQKRHLVLEEPSLDDQVSDLERVFAAMDDLELHAPLGLLRELPGMLRKSGYDVTAVVVDDELIALEPGDTTATCLALAFDLGTTTVVATLLDLTTGQPLSVRSRLNRQHTYGADVIARISATMIDPEALDDLCRQAHWTLAELTEEVCAEAGADPNEIYEIVVAGNVTMIQLALGIDPEPLGVSPFIVASRQPVRALASDFGVTVHPRAPAVTFPALGAYVGPDILAGLIATGLTRDRRIRLFIDVGTNCEIVLGSATRAVATAAPAGPAFEGASIRCGMRAAEGAIEGVRITEDAVEIQVIGDAEPTGICGSGLVDVVSELLRVGLLEPSGRLLTEDEAAERVPGLAGQLERVANGKGGEERVFVLARRGEDPANSVYLSQVDVRRLQEAKAAIATGWKMLVRELGIEETEIQQVLLGGSFGAFLTPASAVRIGLVPPLRGDADRRGRQRRRRRSEDRGALAARAARRDRSARRGRVRRGLGQRRLQRPLPRGADLPGMSALATAGTTTRPKSASAARSGRDRRLRGAGAAREGDRRPAWLADRHPAAASGAPQPAGADRAGGRAGAGAAGGRLRPRCGGIRRLRHARGAGRGSRGHGRRPPQRRHLLRRACARRGADGTGRAAGHVLPHGLPRPHVRAQCRPAARARPAPGAAGRLLRPLHTGGLAGAETNGLAAGRRGRGGGASGPAFAGARGR